MKDGKFVQNYCRLKVRGHLGYPCIDGEDNIKVYENKWCEYGFELSGLGYVLMTGFMKFAGSKNRK